MEFSIIYSYSEIYCEIVLLRIEYLKTSALTHSFDKILDKKNPEISFRIYKINMY